RSRQKGCHCLQRRISKGLDESLGGMYFSTLNLSFSDHGIDSTDLSPSMRKMLSLLSTGASEPDQLTSVWRPPTFDTAEDHISDLCYREQGIVPLGILNGLAIKLSLHGY